MLYTQYLSNFAKSVPTSISQSGREHLLRRLRNEGIKTFSSGLSSAFDCVFEHLSRTGKLPSTRVPFIQDGTILPSAQATEVLDFLGAFSKLEIQGCDPESPWSAFLQRNREVNNFTGTSWEDILPLPRGYGRWIRRKLGTCPTTLMCKHGPGATSERYFGWDKYLPILDPEHHPSSPLTRMTCVPKDWKSHRLIGIEPARRQWIQQGLANALRSTPLFRGAIDLSDQTKHAAFAASASKVCVDLKDASDRIPISLVEYLFPRDWFETLVAYTGSYGQLPSGDVIEFRMFATMGCGFCFEVETLVFHLVACLLAADGDLAILESALTGAVRTYGDDIIIPEWLFPKFAAFCSRAGWIMSGKKTSRTPRFKETVGYWIVNGAPKRRFLPRLQGNLQSLALDEYNRLVLADFAGHSGYGPLSSSLIEGLRTPIRWSNTLHRLEVKLLKKTAITRPHRLADEIRWWAWWKGNRGEPSDLEDCGVTRYEHGWVPLESFPFLHKSFISSDATWSRGWKGIARFAW